MENIEIVKLIFRRGTEVNLPRLNAGEPGFSTDTRKFFIGSTQGNIQLANEREVQQRINTTVAMFEALEARVTALEEGGIVGDITNVTPLPPKTMSEINNSTPNDYPTGLSVMQIKGSNSTCVTQKVVDGTEGFGSIIQTNEREGLKRSLIMREGAWEGTWSEWVPIIEAGDSIKRGIETPELTPEEEAQGVLWLRG